MEIEQSFSVPFPRERVWASFHDTEAIVGCLPGASLTAPPDNGQLKLAMTVKLGPIVASFAGDGEMTLDDASHTGAVSGSGADRKSGSRVKGSAAFSLIEEGDATRVDVKVDYAIAGSLAQFSRGGIVRELATRLTDAFAENLKALLQADAPAPVAVEATTPTIAPATEGEAAPAAAPAAPTTSAAPKTTPAQNAPLDVGNLFWRVLIDRIKSFFRRSNGGAH